jgi:hypothetical protein
VIATNNDPRGHALADQIKALAREDFAVIPDLPEGEGGD